MGQFEGLLRKKRIKGKVFFFPTNHPQAPTQFPISTMRSFTLTASALLFSLIPATQGAALDSWSPTILTPTAGTTWVIGETVTVTWDTMSKPGSITNPKGKIWLKRGDYTITSPDGT